MVPADYHRWEGSSELFGWSTRTRFVKLTPDQWALAGYPEPADEPTAFVRYAWSSRVFLVDVTSGSGAQLSPADWEGYGYPTPLVVDDEEAAFVQRAGDPAVYLEDGGLRFQLTYAEWAAAGYPAPEQLPG